MSQTGKKHDGSVPVNQPDGPELPKTNGATEIPAEPSKLAEIIPELPEAQLVQEVHSPAEPVQSSQTTELAQPELKLNADLLKLYDISIAEYRFQVQLNWDRAKHYLLFNATLLAIVVGVLKLESSAYVDKIVAALFLLPLISSLLGAYSIWKGHTYYRETKRAKKNLEEKLGINEFAISTTPGMRGEPSGRIAAFFKLFFSVTGGLIFVLIMVAVISGIGACVAYQHARRQSDQSVRHVAPNRRLRSSQLSQVQLSHRPSSNRSEVDNLRRLGT